jgi:multicomponent Na+:H+ antiporter subunit G
MWTDWIAAALLLIGALFALLSAVGLVRLPDLYSRMHAGTKAATLGVMCITLAVAVTNPTSLGVATRTILIILFVFLTAPVAAHTVGRAAYRSGTPLWSQSVIDEHPPIADGEPVSSEPMVGKPASPLPAQPARSDKPAAPPR